MYYLIIFVHSKLFNLMSLMQLAAHLADLGLSPSYNNNHSISLPVIFNSV